MAEKTTVEFIEEWQTGFFIVIGCFVAGIVGAYTFGAFELSGIVGFVVGVVATFLVASYLLYGL